jgi:hypothetical protein
MPSVAGRKKDAPSCEDCYFRKKMLCALDLEEPCVTFRPSRPEGLVPPRQPVLLLRPPRWAEERRIDANTGARFGPATGTVPAPAFAPAEGAPSPVTA